MDTKTNKTQAGFVALLGAPNAGKSTLLNQLVGEKLSIVTRKAQTTRMRVLGILSEGDTQIGLIDTPGIFRPKSRLEKAMVRAAWDGLDQANVVVVIVDAASRQPDPKVDDILEVLAHRDRRAILVLNKVDKIRVEKLLPLSEAFAKTGRFDEIFMLSALTGDGIEGLKKYLFSHMPEGAWLYPDDQLTDLPERLLATEITREQLLEQMHDELPYAAAVLPEAWEERKDGSVRIAQTIVVMKPAHRAMILGKNGTRIKEIGQKARTEMMAQMDRTVHLFLDVRVDEKWQERGAFYHLFGLEG